MVMKKIIICCLISFVLAACFDAADEKNKVIDTTIIGSDNPNSLPDSATMNKGDSLKK